MQRKDGLILQRPMYEKYEIINNLVQLLASTVIPFRLFFFLLSRGTPEGLVPTLTAISNCLEFPQPCQMPQFQLKKNSPKHDAATAMLPAGD